MLNLVDESEQQRHKTRYDEVWAEIRNLEGTEVSVKSGGISTNWTVIADSDVPEPDDDDVKDDKFFGLIDDSLCNDESIAKLFLHLWPGDLFDELDNLNLQLILLNNERKKKHQRPYKSVSKRELIVFIGILLASCSAPFRGRELWAPPKNVCISTSSFSRYMKPCRFKELKVLFPMLFWNREDQHSDPWWKFCKAVDFFNETRKKTMKKSFVKVLDESMSAMVQRTS